MTIKLASDPSAIDDALHFLNNGDIVAIPTETVYGLAADATNESAVAKIFNAKNRPNHNPLIVHVASVKDAENLIEIDERLKTLADRFWPGPLTIVGKYKGTNIAKNVMGGLDTLAVRVPAHPIMRNILQKLRKPLAAPSANASGRVSATSPQIVADTLGDKVRLILADGLCESGVESTIIKSENGHIKLLRHGAISLDILDHIAGPIEDFTKPQKKSREKPESPGQLLRHYATKSPIRLDAVDIKEGEALLAFGSTKFVAHENGGFAHDILPETHLLNLSETGDLEEAARHLFAYLHKLDQYKPKAIAIMPLPKKGLGLTLYDRLNRACQAQNMP